MVRATSKVRDDSSYFLQSRVVAVNWSSVDLSAFDTSEAVERALAAHDATKAPNVIAKKRGELRRFLAIQSGDRIIAPMGKVAALCESTGERLHAPDQDALGNQIRVRYVTDDGAPRLVDRSRLSDDLQRKLRGKGCSVLSLDEFSAEIDLLFDRAPLRQSPGQAFPGQR